MRVRMISKLHYKPAEETTGIMQAVINLLSFFKGRTYCCTLPDEMTFLISKGYVMWHLYSAEMQLGVEKHCMGCKFLCFTHQLKISSLCVTWSCGCHSWKIVKIYSWVWWVQHSSKFHCSVGRLVCCWENSM